VCVFELPAPAELIEVVLKVCAHPVFALDEVFGPAPGDFDVLSMDFPVSWVHKVARVIYGVVRKPKIGERLICLPLVRNNSGSELTALLDDWEQCVDCTFVDKLHVSALSLPLVESKHPLICLRLLEVNTPPKEARLINFNSALHLLELLEEVVTD
jgi:hypothetical protein